MPAALIRPPSRRRFTFDGRPVVSFVTPSYLGLERHPVVAAAVARAVARWGVSTATPRALLRDPVTRALEQRLATFVGQPAALMYPSARHAACDVLPVLAGRTGTLCVDQWTYPTSLDGVREAQRRGAQVSVFPHNDVDALRRMLAQGQGPKVVVADGVYVAGGTAAPLTRYVEAAERYSALLYLDDSHGIGVLGRRGAPDRCPFGEGGGGLLRYSGASGHRVVVAGTLTKALGAPVAFVAGDAALLDRVAAASHSFVHSSPPSIANMAAAAAALAVQGADGERLRRRLATLVTRFRDAINAAGLEIGSHDVFPIQTVPVPDGIKGDIGRALIHHGVWALLQHRPTDFPRRRVLRFFLTALHCPADIDLAASALGEVMHARAPIGGARHASSPPWARRPVPSRRPPGPRGTRPRISRRAAAGGS